jgi:hypothetical protein
MPLTDGYLDRIAEEAVEDLAKGNRTWREISPNAMMLVVYAAQKARNEKFYRKVAAPFWFVGSIAAAGVIWWAICGIFGIG